MIKVVGISFKNNKKIYNFSPNNLKVRLNDLVVVNTENGEQMGTISRTTYSITDDKLKAPLSEIVRLADETDVKNYEKNLELEAKAIKKCRELTDKYNLNMYIVSATYTLDRKQLVFKFMADNRVDFRNLAKELATIFKTRIELRQMGVRDRAKEVTGYGLCGQKLCCSRFMDNFDSVSINMAKTQNIALNPTKINGVCGRLLCCLNYENECYMEYRKGMPALNKKIVTDKGEGKVISIDILRRTYKVNIPEVGIIEYDLNESNK